MSSLTRLRHHAGLWSMVAALATATVFVTAIAGPVTTRIADDALRQEIRSAPYRDRDIITVREAQPALMGTPPTPPENLRLQVVTTLPDPLLSVMGDRWAYLRTSVSTFEGVGAALTGDGVRAEPAGYAPVVAFHYQPGLLDEVALVDGGPPATDLEDAVIEVVVAARVAEKLGLVVGGEYALHPGRTATALEEPAPDSAPTVRISGVFVPRDGGAAVWDHAPLLLSTATTAIPVDQPPLSATRADLITDSHAFQLIFDRRLTAQFFPDTAVRVRLDPDLVDAAWVPGAIDALAQFATSPRIPDVRRETGLADLLDNYLRQAAAARAVIAVAASGIVATLLGLLLLAARLIADRRRGEVDLVRARGGSVARATGWLLAEALWVVPLAGIAGWVLHRLALGDLVPGTVSAAALAPAAAGLVAATLMVPVAGASVARRSGAVVPVRRDLARRRSTPGRLTMELSVTLLAALGVALVHTRGLSRAGVDPYLSAVPVLLAVAAGLVALRLFPWPVRALAAVARRLPGAVGFVGLARAGRAAPGAALALLVLVLAVAVGGFAGAVTTGVVQARDAAAVQQVGAHVRVESEGLPEDAVRAVAAVPGVTGVVPVSRGGVLSDGAGRVRGASIQGPLVVVVDTVAYQDLLVSLGVERRLPERVLSVSAGAATIPVLAGGPLAARDGLLLRRDGGEWPLEVVGDVAGLPGPDRNRSWLLVPRQALPDPGPAGELLVAGAGADPEQVGAAVAGLVGSAEVTVSSVAAARAALERAGFNGGLTLVFVAGAAGGALGGVLAVTLALVVQARARGRMLSLLRTMGLSHRQARVMLMIELLPVTAVAVAVGSAVGVAMPPLLAPALALDAFTGGIAPGAGVDATTVVALAGLVVLLVVAGAAVEAALNRRLGLGGVLRVD